MTRPECFVTALTGVGQYLDVSFDMIPYMVDFFVPNFPTVSTGVVTIVSSDDILSDLLINLLSVGDGRVIGHCYG